MTPIQMYFADYRADQQLLKRILDQLDNSSGQLVDDVSELLMGQYITNQNIEKAMRANIAATPTEIAGDYIQLVNDIAAMQDDLALLRRRILEQRWREVATPIGTLKVGDDDSITISAPQEA